MGGAARWEEGMGAHHRHRASPRQRLEQRRPCDRQLLVQQPPRQQHALDFDGKSGRESACSSPACRANWNHAVHLRPKGTIGVHQRRCRAAPARDWPRGVLRAFLAGVVGRREGWGLPNRASLRTASGRRLAAAHAKEKSTRAYTGVARREPGRNRFARGRRPEVACPSRRRWGGGRVPRTSSNTSGTTLQPFCALAVADALCAVA